MERALGERGLGSSRMILLTPTLFVRMHKGVASE
jgi:hypothetical protein